MGYCREIKNGEVCGGKKKQFGPKIHFYECDSYDEGVSLHYEIWCPKCYIVADRFENYTRRKQ